MFFSIFHSIIDYNIVLLVPYLLNTFFIHVGTLGQDIECVYSVPAMISYPNFILYFSFLT